MTVRAARHSRPRRRRSRWGARAARRHVATAARRALGHRRRERQRQEHVARPDRRHDLAGTGARHAALRFRRTAKKRTRCARAARSCSSATSCRIVTRAWRWNFTALDVVLSGIYRTDVPRRRPAAEQRERALAVLRRLGVAESRRTRKFLELSRGEQRRVLIARGVAFEPTVLLLDEPASGLDRRVRAASSTRCSSSSPRNARSSARRTCPDDLPHVIARYLSIDRGRVVARRARARARARPPRAVDGVARAASSGEATAAPPADRPLIELDARRRVARGPARAARRHVAARCPASTGS